MKKKTETAEKVERAGTMPSLDVPHYPKRYTVEITEQPDGRVTIRRLCENMTGWELYGVLHVLLVELERQLTIRDEPDAKENTI